MGEFVRGKVEETLNAMLDIEADAICNAQKYEHTPERKDMRAGSYRHKLQTRAGELNLKVPKLRMATLYIIVASILSFSFSYKSSFVLHSK